MRRRALSLAITVAAGGALLVVPRWTAAHEEMRRQAAFADARQSEPIRALPDCPPAGPELDAFLQAREDGLKAIGEAGLWIPVCRVVAPRPGKVIIVSVSRSGLASCRNHEANPLLPIDCALEEPLRFLADPSEARTWAREEATGADGNEFIWMSAESLAWDVHLVEEHRQRLVWLLAALSVTTMLALGWRRTGMAQALRSACHAPGEPDVPRGPEFLLHWLLGRRAPSMPGDLSQEYTEKLKSDGRKAEVDRWYRWQVFHSVAPLLARQAERFLEKFGRGWRCPGAR